MSQTYLLLAAVWVMFGCCAVVAFTAWRRGKKIDRWIAEYRKRADGQSEEK